VRGKVQNANRSLEGDEFIIIDIQPLQGCGRCFILSVRFTHGYSDFTPSGYYVLKRTFTIIVVFHAQSLPANGVILQVYFRVMRYV
jgi:hypothetical protein